MSETTLRTAPKTAPKTASKARTVEHFDVLIVGAGISGVGSAYQLTKQLPGTSLCRARNTGELRRHLVDPSLSRHPLRQRSAHLRLQLQALGRPADRERRRDSSPTWARSSPRTVSTSISATSTRFLSANWSSAEKLWTVEATRTDTGEALLFTCNFLWMCQGYYRHSEGYTPEWKDMDKYKGRIVHPQTWPEDLETKGKNIVVIGSGATAATLLPAIADDCGHIVMLQRSPTYFRTGRNAIELAEELRKLQVSEEWIHEIVRRKILFEQDAFTRASFEKPEKVKQELIGNIRSLLGPDYDVDTHFTPKYRPWRQRIAFVPDADLFQCSQERQGLGRHRRDRPLHGDRHSAEVRQAA